MLLLIINIFSITLILYFLYNIIANNLITDGFIYAVKNKVVIFHGNIKKYKSFTYNDDNFEDTITVISKSYSALLITLIIYIGNTFIDKNRMIFSTYNDVFSFYGDKTIFQQILLSDDDDTSDDNDDTNANNYYNDDIDDNTTDEEDNTTDEEDSTSSNNDSTTNNDDTTNDDDELIDKIRNMDQEVDFNDPVIMNNFKKILNMAVSNYLDSNNLNSETTKRLRKTFDMLRTREKEEEILMRTLDELKLGKDF